MLRRYPPGRYFICNGIERLLRLLIAPRRNYVSAVNRVAFHCQLVEVHGRWGFIAGFVFVVSVSVFSKTVKRKP